MGFVRTVNYTFGPEWVVELQRGSDLYLRLVAAHKSFCQNSAGLLDAGVWITQETGGNIRVLSYSEWDSIENMAAFAEDPYITRQERIIGQAASVVPPRVDTYEVIG